jgi:hypothetical protein
MILPVLSRRPVVGYPHVALATVLTGVFGFGVWVHYMFAVGMSYMEMSFFSAASMTISLFSAALRPRAPRAPLAPAGTAVYRPAATDDSAPHLRRSCLLVRAEQLHV